MPFSTYDAAGRVLTVSAGVGTAIAAVTQTSTYTANGKLATIKDGENNLTTYEYDGFDRLSKTRYPVTTKGAGTSSTTDYGQLTYDANSNVTLSRLRDGNTISFTFDNLNRVTSRTPSGENTVNYQYNLVSNLIAVQRPADGVTSTMTYNALGRLLSEGQAERDSG